jgi:serine O-acetyltransferase
MLRILLEDLRAVARNDPAARSTLETLLCHAPLHAIWLHRIAHWLHERARLRFLARLLSAFGRFLTGVEIHPAASIGRRFFIDHGIGVVIGETAVVGDDCVMFHNVTLGGTGHLRGRRHPTLGNRVLVGTGSTLLGPIAVGDDAKVGANSLIIMRDVPADATVVGSPAHIVKLKGERVELELPRTKLPAEPAALRPDRGAGGGAEAPRG